jgi:periplasmic protein CpxP/Spy
MAVVLAAGTSLAGIRPRVAAASVGTSQAAGTATGTEPIDHRRVTMFAPVLLRGLALAALLVPSIGFAQSAPTAQPSPTATPPAASPAAAQPAAPVPSAAVQTAVDQRIRTLQSQLGITEAQMPLWTAFAQAMRDNATSTDALFTQRASAVASMSAVDNMRSYAQIARAYADNTERLATAFESLYASLTETQKQAADTLFRQQASATSQQRTRR